MSDSSPAPRRSRQWSSPDRDELSVFLSENRNNELLHLEALAAAQAEHERVREAAIRAYQTHELKEQNRRLREQQERIQEAQRKEEERIRNEERVRLEQERLRALKAKTIPKLPPEEVPSTTASPLTPAFPLGNSREARGQQPQSNGTLNAPSALGAKPAVQPPQAQPVQQPPPPAESTAKPGNFAAPQQQQQQQQQNGFSTAPKPPQAAIAPAAPTPTSTAASTQDRYVEIHQNLKKLRASIAEQQKASPSLKQRAGSMRRELRKNLGQLVGEKGGNKNQIRAIQAILNESLTQIPSAPMDPSHFLTDKREPVEGAIHNDPQMPSLFLYLLNQFAKAIINQFIQECSGQPKTADPIGVVAALIFSKKEYCWRGKTLIDILMAKFRVVCPVLFGYRGSEKTEQGRRRLGWRKEGDTWVSEQLHISRMQGLAVGYAAIALRDFALSANTSPWPPSRYWSCMARIVNTPPAEISNTQCVILRSMIEHYEDKFMNFYGTAAIAALRKALVEFPNKAQEKTQGAWGLLGLADVLKLNIGLEL